MRSSRKTLNFQDPDQHLDVSESGTSAAREVFRLFSHNFLIFLLGPQNFIFISFPQGFIKLQGQPNIL